MKFNWDRFTKENYENMITNNAWDLVGVVNIGDICIELLKDISYINDDGFVQMCFNFYVLHEDFGYNYTDEGNIPYDYADGFDFSYNNMTYEEFKTEAEMQMEYYIMNYNGAYSLVEHANKELVIW